MTHRQKLDMTTISRISIIKWVCTMTVSNQSSLNNYFLWWSFLNHQRIINSLSRLWIYSLLFLLLWTLVLHCKTSKHRSTASLHPHVSVLCSTLNHHHLSYLFSSLSENPKPNISFNLGAPLPPTTTCRHRWLWSTVTPSPSSSSNPRHCGSLVLVLPHLSQQPHHQTLVLTLFTTASISESG